MHAMTTMKIESISPCFNEFNWSEDEHRRYDFRRSRSRCSFSLFIYSLRNLATNFTVEISKRLTAIRTALLIRRRELDGAIDNRVFLDSQFDETSDKLIESDGQTIE